MSDLRAFASTSNIVRFSLKNKTTGQGLTGLTISTSGLIISTIADNEATPTVYTQAGSTIETITTLGTFAAPTATKCRFKLVDNTNHPGLYEFQFADARFAVANAKRLVISVNDAESTILDADYEIELVQFNPFDSVRLGLTSLPAAVPGAANGVFIAGTNAATTVTTSLTTTFTGNLTGSVGSVTSLQVKKNTALAAFEFVMFDSSGNPKTGLTVTATRSLDGAAFGACANAVAEVANGVYKISLAAADLNANTVMLQFAAALNRTTFVFLTPQP